MEKIRSFNEEKSAWVQVDAHEVETIRLVQEKYQISDEMLTYSLDRNERARVEFDSETQAFLLIFNVPHREKTENHYETSPMTFIIKGGRLFTFTTVKTQYVNELMERILHKTPLQGEYSLLFHTLFVISDAFFPLIEEVNSQRTRLNNKLREKTTNKNLIAMSDLEIGLVYLVSATKQNAVLLQQVQAQSIYHHLNEVEKEQLEDALIEAKQAVEMTQLASQVLEQLSGAYNNLLNNNLNDTMKFLTIWSLLLTVPTIVTGFFGMNVPLPFSNSVFGWGIAMLISIVLAVWMLLAMWRKIK
ncbi:magnesium transporter CorA family protein [Enterococcus diestrammenae]|uniref:magnesium transporter CorA family protein n=1 Tax=Enterococcus diestrammenae TaxID=1155073 RepID=UPI001F897B52|nr:magnesium transporter CorA family protein [Enterococcus diestrammenae]HIX70212.1 magnesium transporter CorA family protein [Candidatus Enterococcus stercoravium]